MPSEATRTLLRGGRLTAAAQDNVDSLLIEARRIAWIGRAKDAPSADRIIDLQDSRVVPAESLELEHLYFALQAALDGLGMTIG